MPDTSVPVNTDMSEVPAAPSGNWIDSSMQLEHSPLPIQIALTGQTSTTRPWDELPSDPRVRPWKDIKISESATPLHPQTKAATPLTRRVGVADECDPKGIFPLDTADMVTRHWRRSFPSLYDTTPKVLQEFGNFMADTRVYDVGMLTAWLEKKPKLHAMMTGIFRDTYPWNDLVHGSHDFGAWWHAPLKQSMPDQSDLCRVGSATNVVVSQFERSIHSTNFYTLMNILEQGLQCGPWDVGKKRGIFSFKPNGLARAKASSGYRTYSDLLHNGYFWGVALELVFPSDLSFRCGSITAGQQTVTPAEETYITGLWFQCVHVSDHCKAEDCQMWCACDDWTPDYEMRRQQAPWREI
jgi:hypothetical protein